MLRRVNNLGTFKMGRLCLLMALRIYLQAMMHLMIGLLAHGRAGRRAVLIVFALRILGILLMSKVVIKPYNVVIMSAEVCVNDWQAASRTNRESPVAAVAAATQNSTRLLRTQFEHGTATQCNFSSSIIYTRVAIQYGLTLPVTLHLKPTTFWTGHTKSARWRHSSSHRKQGPIGRRT